MLLNSSPMTLGEKPISRPRLFTSSQSFFQAFERKDCTSGTLAKAPRPRLPRTSITRIVSARVLVIDNRDVPKFKPSGFIGTQASIGHEQHIVVQLGRSPSPIFALGLLSAFARRSIESFIYSSGEKPCADARFFQSFYMVRTGRGGILAIRDVRLFLIPVARSRSLGESCSAPEVFRFSLSPLRVDGYGIPCQPATIDFREIHFAEKKGRKWTERRCSCPFTYTLFRFPSVMMGLFF